MKVGDAVIVGVTLGVGVGVSAITSPSIHPWVSIILITKLDSEYGAGTTNWYGNVATVETNTQEALSESQ